MLMGNTKLAILFRDKVERSGLVELLRKEWKTASLRNKITFEDYRPEFQQSLTGEYFELDCATDYQREILRDIVGKDIEQYSAAVIFPSDRLIGTIASCYTSMLFSRRWRLLNELKDNYGYDNVREYSVMADLHKPNGTE